MKGEDILFSTAKHERNGKIGIDDWETPRLLIDAIEHDMGATFDLDLAGTEANKKAPRVITKEMNALKCEWPDFESAFCNPPYSIADDFLRRSVRELANYQSADRTVTFLLPARTDKKIFQEMGYWIGEIWFLTGRVSFEFNGAKQGTAPFPSMILVLSHPDYRSETPPFFDFWQWR